jgi:hypothetical protein
MAFQGDKRGFGKAFPNHGLHGWNTDYTEGSQRIAEKKLKRQAVGIRQ